VTGGDLREEIMEIYGLPDVLRESWRAIWRGTPLWMAQDWTVETDGYRLVIENGAMTGLAYEEWPPSWFGSIRSARTDTAGSTEAVLREGFGRPGPFPDSRVLDPAELAALPVTEPPPGLPYRYFGMCDE
jgi:hypothetical protein